MNKIPLVILVFILFFSCNAKKENESVDELLIFGYSGYLCKDSANNYYTLYDYYRCDSIKLEIDSTRLNINQYFEYKKDGFVKIALQRKDKETEYHKIAKFDTIGLERIINKTLINKIFKIEYKEEGVAYDGLRYTLFCKTNYEKEFSIDYFPSALPESLKMMHDYIQGIIMKENPVLIDKFVYNPVITRETKRISKNYPFPPSKSVQEIEFISPK